jgi:hypothetical protein
MQKQRYNFKGNLQQVALFYAEKFSRSVVKINKNMKFNELFIKVGYLAWIIIRPILILFGVVLALSFILGLLYGIFGPDDFTTSLSINVLYVGDYIFSWGFIIFYLSMCAFIGIIVSIINIFYKIKDKNN